MEHLLLWNKMEPLKQNNIGSLANSFRLSEEDIRILTFASKPLKENVKHEELQFDQNVFKKPSIYETLG
jgi:hypothetical protein